MTLYLRPLGRGNWTAVIVSIESSRHAPVPIEVRQGDRVSIAGRMFRVSRIGP